MNMEYFFCTPEALNALTKMLRMSLDERPTHKTLDKEYYSKAEVDGLLEDIGNRIAALQQSFNEQIASLQQSIDVEATTRQWYVSILGDRISSVQDAAVFWDPDDYEEN